MLERYLSATMGFDFFFLHAVQSDKTYCCAIPSSLGVTFDGADQVNPSQIIFGFFPKIYISSLLCERTTRKQTFDKK